MTIRRGDWDKTRRRGNVCEDTGAGYLQAKEGGLKEATLPGTWSWTSGLQYCEKIHV